MSIKVTTEVWKGSRHRSGNLLVLLALADHADDEGKAWPGVRSLARKARLSQRHTRRCLNELLATGELTILAQRAPSGGKLFQIQLEQLAQDNLSVVTSATDDLTPVSDKTDSADHGADTIYIEEPSNKPSKESRSEMKLSHTNLREFPKKYSPRRPNAIGLVSSPKSGF